MEMSQILKFGLIGFGAYLIYQRFSGVAGGGGVITPTPGAGGTAPVTGGGGVIVAPGGGSNAAPIAVSDEVLQAAASNLAAAQALNSNVRYSVDQWNYYNAAATGVPNPDPVAVGMITGDRGELISAVEYHARRANAGLSGLRGIVPFRAVWAR